MSKESNISEATFKKHCLVIDKWAVNGFNGTKAYQSIYPDAKDRSAESSFREIVANSRIQDYIKTKYKEAQVHLDTSHEQILSELRNWAMSDITETIGLTPEQVKALPIELKRLITKYKHSKRSGDGWKEEVIELTFVSKEKAMEMIHKHTGFYEKDNEQSNQVIKISFK